MGLRGDGQQHLLRSRHRRRGEGRRPPGDSVDRVGKAVVKRAEAERGRNMRVSRELEEKGFVVIPGPATGADLARLTGAYDAVMASATEPDLRVGSTTTRVSDMVNRGEEFDAVYVYGPLLEACRRVIGKPFKLSSLVARTLRP